MKPIKYFSSIIFRIVPISILMVFMMSAGHVFADQSMTFYPLNYDGTNITNNSATWQKGGSGYVQVGTLPGIFTRFESRTRHLFS